MSNVVADAPPRQSATADERLFSRYAWVVLAFNILVVLWGAFVRATGSGAGCGNHWPLCNGSVVPRAPRIETIIEFTHRLTSGLSLALVGWLCLWAHRLYPRGHRARFFAYLSGLFLISEALLGAGLVLFQYVEHNASAGRVIYLSAHLVNTQILLGMLIATAWFASGAKRLNWRGVPRTGLAALPAFILVAVSGAIAALGDTLFPAATVAAGIREDFSGTASFLVQLRTLHPAFAVAAALLLLSVASSAARTNRPLAVRAAAAVAILVFCQLGAGIANIVLLAPVWMQIVHLFIADILWVALVLLVLENANAVENPAREPRLA